MLDIGDLADRAPYQLSGGQKKRVAIASVLVMNPEVLLFDEPTAALDPRTQQWLLELIDELHRAGKTIVVATHDLEHLDLLADRCVVFCEDHRIAVRRPDRADPGRHVVAPSGESRARALTRARTDGPHPRPPARSSRIGAVTRRRAFRPWW